MIPLSSIEKEEESEDMENNWATGYYMNKKTPPAKKLPLSDETISTTFLLKGISNYAQTHPITDPISRYYTTSRLKKFIKSSINKKRCWAMPLIDLVQVVPDMNQYFLQISSKCNQIY